jgi:hypothetical protein
MSQPEVIEFHNDEAGYEDWLRLHNHDGYVVTKKGRDWALHRADCDHISSTDADGALYTRNPKLCSTDRAALDREARKRSDRPPIQPCETCGS